MKARKILLATNLSVTHFAVKLANMLCDGLKGIEVYPEFVSRPSKNNVCIVAYVGEMPADVLDFIRKNKNKQILIFLDHAAQLSLGPAMEELEGFLIRDEPIQVVYEVWKLLEFLEEK